MTKEQLNQLGKTLWDIADDLRGAMNADDFRDYMLSFLFLRYLSDNYEAAAKKEDAPKWHWRYRFEAYTPAPKRQLGYYALPLLWGDRVIGWGNVSVVGGALNAHLGYVDGAAPREA